MRPPYYRPSPIVRLSVRPDEPDTAMPPRPRGSRRPHTDARVAAVRRLIEDTPLTYGEIARRTDVGRASICRWTRDQGWRRHVFAPRSTDTVPRPRASAKLKRRTLSARLDAMAERWVRELEEAPGIDLDKLAQALELAKMAKLAGMGRRRRRLPADAAGGGALSEPLRPIIELCLADIDLHRAPREAVEDFLANRAPPQPEPGRRRPRRPTRREEHHAWMLEKYDKG